MLTFDGAKRLRQFSSTAYPFRIHEINPRIRHVVGLGHSNATVIEGDTSLILIDTLDSDARAKRMIGLLQGWSKKPVKTIIFTHGHPDHRGGSGAFRNTVQEIIAFAPPESSMEHYDKIQSILLRRGIRQFGYELTDEECLTQGLGIREGHACGDGSYDFLAPTTIYHEEMVERTIDGVKICMAAAPGENDDEIFIWLPDDRVMCCGDNYYGCWPNLYAIRGGQYRDVARWIQSLKKIKSYPSQALLAGHTNPIFGTEHVAFVLEHYTNAIESVLTQTLECIQMGMSESQTVEAVHLSKEEQALPFLGEFYGTVQWSVRSIYQGYLGWFDGNPTNLNRLSDRVYAKELLTLIGADRALKRVQEALSSGEYQLALQLSDLLIDGGHFIDDAKQCKKAALLKIAELETSANGRHYYLTCAKEI